MLRSIRALYPLVILAIAAVLSFQTIALSAHSLRHSLRHAQSKKEAAPHVHQMQDDGCDLCLAYRAHSSADTTVFSLEHIETRQLLDQAPLLFDPPLAVLVLAGARAPPDFSQVV